MKLLFDLTATQPSPEAKFHGGGRYAEIIFFRLIELKKIFSCIYDSTKYINPQIISICQDNQISLYDISDDSISNIVRKYNIDILYSALPYFLHKQNIESCTIIGTIHGLRGLETPLNKDIFKYDFDLKTFIKFLFKKICPNKYVKLEKRKLDILFRNPKFKFVTVSNHSKYSIMCYFPYIKDEDIEVYYSPSTINTVINKKEKRDKYFLLVSGNRWVKNNYRAIIAFDQLFEERPYLDFKVIVTGISSNSKLKKKIKNKSRFIFYDYVENNILEQLYANAYCFVYPSVNEGFGYPPLEAMVYGVPVIASPITSISEICGNACLYFNPFSIAEIKNRILMVLDDSIFKEYSKKSLSRYKVVLEKQVSDLDALISYFYN